jgi:hypothetical protein
MAPEHSKKPRTREKRGMILPLLERLKGRRANSADQGKAGTEVQLSETTPKMLASESPCTVLVPEDAMSALGQIDVPSNTAS